MKEISSGIYKKETCVVPGCMNLRKSRGGRRVKKLTCRKHSSDKDTRVIPEDIRHEAEMCMLLYGNVLIKDGKLLNRVEMQNINLETTNPLPDASSGA